MGADGILITCSAFGPAIALMLLLSFAGYVVLGSNGVLAWGDYTRQLRSAKLELKKTVESGQVRQSFSHGRSKVVQVERKKKRQFEIGADGKVQEVKAPPAALKAKADEVLAKAKEALAVFDILAEKDSRPQLHYNRCVVAQAVLTGGNGVAVGGGGGGTTASLRDGRSAAKAEPAEMASARAAMEMEIFFMVGVSITCERRFSIR